MPVKIVTVSTEKLCPKRPRMSVLGCATVVHGKCWILISHKPLPIPRSEVIRHERAHCNGWASHHPR